MQHDLMLGGHAWERRFFYTSNGIYHELTVPGGAAMLASILGDLAAPIALPDSALCEHIQLINKNAKAGDSYYAGAHAGWSEGSAAVKTEDARATVIWDEGLGDIAIAENASVLWISKKALPSKETVDLMGEGCLLMLDVDVLRANGAMISRQVSWEHSATDLIWQLANNPAISYLSKLQHIIIPFAEDGAVHLKRQADKFEPVLVLTHGGAEGTLRDRYPGHMPDAWTIMAAEVAIQFQDVINGTKPLLLYPALKSAEALLKTGYDLDLLEAGEYREWLGAGLDKGEGYAYTVPVYDSSLGADPHFWCIGSEAQGRKISHVAFEYVKDGSRAIEGLPQLSFGGLTTVDRKEIESFQNIKNLIVEYVNGKASRPLSIAVFGAPGSGKSFGVTQIAKNILPGVIEKLEFNVSQFIDNADLAAAFHQVRDVILAGKLPLVFFDEFDSDRDGQLLGWLKSFLMPMQDGKFKDVSGEHPIGKCIFVFAGGTSPSFEDFCAPMNPGHYIENQKGFDELNILKKKPEDAEKELHFKNVKGPDFVSRLRGTINVLGPNPVGEKDQSYILRRALLLRSLCERKFSVKSGKMPISDDVLRAMLLVPKYKHGARSMESILDMSRIEGANWEPASLPFKTQLSLHVDADVFIKLVLNEVRLNSFTNKLARVIHEDFVKKQTERGATGPYVIPWGQLPETVREDNRRQVRAISVKLRAVGCSYDAGDTPYPSIKEFTEDEILILARMEHDMWMAGKRAAGYVYGEVRKDIVAWDDDGIELPPTHPDMIPWEALSEEAKQKDIDTVKNIIPLLHSVGLRVYRTI